MSKFSGFIRNSTVPYFLNYGIPLAAGAGLGLASALFLKNDDRGFLSTSLITVPVAAAASVAAVEAFRGFAPAASQIGRTAVALAREGEGFTGFVKHPLSTLRALAESGGFAKTGDVLSPMFLQAQHALSLAAYADAMASPQATEPLEQAAARIRDKISQFLAAADSLEPDKAGALRQGLYYALQAEIQNASPYAEFLKNPDLASFDRFDTQIPNELMLEKFDQLTSLLNQGNPDALRSLTAIERRMSYLEKNQDLLTQSYHASYYFGKYRDEGILPLEPIEKKFDEIEELKSKIVQSYPELEPALNSAISSKSYEKVTLLEDESGKILGIRFYYGKKTLDVGFVDRSTGKVHFGENFSLQGVARMVGEPGQSFYLDEYLLSHLDENWRDLADLQSRAIVFSNINVDESAIGTPAALSEHLHGLIDEPTAEFRRLQVVPSTLPVFGGKRFDELSQEEKIAFLQEHADRLRKYGSESSFRNLVMEQREIEKIRVGQMFSMSQQEPVFRAYSKPFRLEAETVPERLRGGVFSSRLKQIFSGTVPAASVSVAGVNPRQVAFFASLPDSPKKLRDPAIRSQLLGHLTEDILADLPDIGREEAAARASRALETLEARASKNPNLLKQAKALGTLGETEFLLSPEFRSLDAGEVSIYKLVSVSDFVRTAVNERPDNAVLEGSFLGYSKSGKPVFAAGDETQVLRLVPNGENEISLYVKEKYRLDSGVKADILGRKGLVTVAPSQTAFETQLDVLNLLYSETGRGRPYAEGVQAFANAEYFTSKIKEESFLALLENARSLAEQNPGLRASLAQILEPEQFRLETVGNALQLIENSDMVFNLTDAQKAERISRIARNVESWINSNAMATPLAPAIEQAVQAGIVQTPSEYLHRYRQAATMAVWDTTLRNIPEATSLTFDVLGLLHQQGEYEIVKNLLENSSPVSGDTRMAWDYLSRLSSGEFQPKEGDYIASLEEIPLRSGFTDPGELAGTVFDPFNRNTQKNYWVDLGREVEFELGNRKIRTRYVPVPGNEAYRAGVNQYAPGLGATSELQRNLMSMAKEVLDMDYFASEADFGAPVKSYLENVIQNFAGKRGILRSRIESHASIQGAIQSRPSKSRVRIGDQIIHDPFEFVISRSYLEEPGMMPPDIRRKLLSGEEVYGVLFRHPVSATPIGRIRVASESDYLAPNAIGIDESLRSLLQADSDKDLAYVMFLTSDEAIDRARKATLAHLPVDESGIRTISDWNSVGFQWRQVRAVQLLQGSTEDPARMTASYIRQNLADKTLIGETLATMEKLAGEGPVSPARLASLTQRTASDTIGFYSNLLSGLYLNLENHPDLILSPAERATLVPVLWNIRQVPISAQKGKMAFGSGNAMQLAYQMLAGMRAADTETGFDLVHDALVKISEGSGFETLVNSAQDVADIKELFGLEDFFDAAAGARRPIQPGARFNLFSEYLKSDRGKDLIRKFVSGRNRSIDDLAALLTSSEIDPDRALNIVRRMKTQGMYGAEYLRGYLAGGRPAASMSAQILGAINQSLSRGVDAAGSRIKKALPILVAGAALAAGVGLLMTPIRKQKRADEAAGETDTVPGEPVPGSEAANPPVEVRSPRQGVKRAVIASVQKSVSARVEARVKDSGEEAEVEKAARRAAGGDDGSTVYITRFGGHRERMSRLRMRQELREKLEREAVY